MSDCLENHDPCPVCETGDWEGHECWFCDGYGFLDHIEWENSYEGALDYTTYVTYLNAKSRFFQHSTNQIVVPQGPTYFDDDGVPPEDKFIDLNF